MPRKPRKEAILKVRITDDLKGEVERIADATGETVAVIVRQALRDFVDRQKHAASRDTLHPTGSSEPFNPLQSLPRVAEPAADYDPPKKDGTA